MYHSKGLIIQTKKNMYRASDSSNSCNTTEAVEDTKDLIKQLLKGKKSKN